jgi:hypothetical protein
MSHATRAAAATATPQPAAININNQQQPLPPQPHAPCKMQQATQQHRQYSISNMQCHYLTALLTTKTTWI